MSPSLVLLSISSLYCGERFRVFDLTWMVAWDSGTHLMLAQWASNLLNESERVDGCHVCMELFDAERSLVLSCSLHSLWPWIDVVTLCRRHDTCTRSSGHVNYLIAGRCTTVARHNSACSLSQLGQRDNPLKYHTVGAVFMSVFVVTFGALEYGERNTLRCRSLCDRSAPVPVFAVLWPCSTDAWQFWTLRIATFWARSANCDLLLGESLTNRCTFAEYQMWAKF
jgi:hypothetical protein